MANVYGKFLQKIPTRATATVALTQVSYATLTVDKTSGYEGDIVTFTATNIDSSYEVGYFDINGSFRFGTASNTYSTYSFSLVAGENTAKLVMRAKQSSSGSGSSSTTNYYTLTVNEVCGTTTLATKTYIIEEYTRVTPSDYGTAHSGYEISSYSPSAAFIMSSDKTLTVTYKKAIDTTAVSIWTSAGYNSSTYDYGLVVKISNNTGATIQGTLYCGSSKENAHQFSIANGSSATFSDDYGYAVERGDYSGTYSVSGVSGTYTF